MWGGGAWQWGDSVLEEYAYANDEAEDSAYLHSDSLSYYTESPALEQDFYACSTSNTASVPTLYPDPGAANFKVPHKSAMLDQASCFSKVKEHLTPSLKNSFIQDQGAPFCASGKQAPAVSMRNDSSSSGKLDARSFSIQVSSQMSSPLGITSQPKMKQVTTDITENRCAQTDSSKPFVKSCCNSSDEHGSLEAIELKHSIQATSNPTSTLELLEGINLDAQTVSISAEVIQKEVDSRNRSSPQSSSTSGPCQLLSNSGPCPGMPIPKHINAQAHYSSLIETAPLEQRNMRSLLNEASLVMEMKGKPCVKAINHEAMHQDKMDSSHNLPGNARLYLNGPQLLVKCIHNLSKVLLSSQSGTSLNILDPNDCFAIENTICILSHRLSQSSITEAHNQNCHQLQVVEQESKISDDMLTFNEEAGSETSQQKCSFLLEGMKHKMKASPSRVLENEALDCSSKVMASNCIEGDERADQSLFVKKELEKPWEDLLMLQCDIVKLQEEVAYERSESNATVMTYKKLWSEAQEALKVSRSEIKDLRAELASLKQDFTNLKHSGGPGELGGVPTDLEFTKYDMNTSCINQGGFHENLLDAISGSSQCFTEQDLHSAPNDDRYSAFCGSAEEPFSACSDVLTEYPEKSNCRETWTPYATGEKVIRRHNNQSGNRFEISASEPSSKQVAGAPTNIKDEVTRRLSLLLARQGLDLNKTGTDRNVESSSCLSTILEASSNLPRDGDAMPPDKKENYLIWSETSANKGIGVTEPAIDINYGHHSLLERESNTMNTRNVDVEDVSLSTCQEDEIEIICLKPGVAETSFTCLKGEPEWEHVVVNALDDQKTTRQGDNFTHRKVHR